MNLNENSKKSGRNTILNPNSYGIQHSADEDKVCVLNKIVHKKMKETIHRVKNLVPPVKTFLHHRKEVT